MGSVLIFNSSGGLAGAAIEAAAGWLVAISDLLGLVGERKMKDAVANGNGVQ